MASLSTNSTHPAPVYLVDFSVYKPPEELLVDRDLAEERGKNWSVSVLLPTVPASYESHVSSCMKLCLMLGLRSCKAAP
jgi:hypothetical protein